MRLEGVEIKTIDIVTFLGMIITLFTSILNLFQNKKSIYINNITRYRVSWINTLRVHTASLKELSNVTNLYINTKDGSNKIKYRRELDKIVSLIKLHLNFEGELDNKFIEKIEDLKSIINSYLILFFYKKEIDLTINDDDLVMKFNEVIDIISEKRVLIELINIVSSDEKIEIDTNIKTIGLLDLKKEIKLIYLSDYCLIRKAARYIEDIIQDYEEKIEEINNEIDEIAQIYLKAEWIKCKRETKMWPFSIYNESKTIKELQDKFKTIN